MSLAGWQPILMRVAIWVTRAATLSSEMRMVSNRASRQNDNFGVRPRNISISQ